MRELPPRMSAASAGPCEVDGASTGSPSRTGGESGPAPTTVNMLLDTVNKRRRSLKRPAPVADAVEGGCNMAPRIHWDHISEEWADAEQVNKEWEAEQAGQSDFAQRCTYIYSPLPDGCSCIGVSVKDAIEAKLGSGLVLQFHDKPDAPFPELRRWNRWYAERHGYDYRLHDGQFEDGKTISPYWGKVKAVCESMARYEYIMMLDTDAVVHDMERCMEDLFEDGKEFVYSGDSPALSWESPFCAGVFIVRTSDKMVDMFRRWLALYPAKKWWQDEDGSWTCPKSCEWAGPDYEQGAFVEHFLKPVQRTDTEYDANRREFGRLLQPVDPLVLQSGMRFQANPLSFTLHFAGEGKVEIEAYLRERRLKSVYAACASVGVSYGKLEGRDATEEV